MKRRAKSVLAVLFLILASSFLFGEEAEAEVCPPGQYSKHVGGGVFVCKGALTEETQAEGSVSSINEYIQYTALTIAGLSASFAVAVIVYAGFVYTTSAGDAKMIQKAKQLILQAGIGIFIALLSFVVLGIINAAAGVPILS